MDVSIRDYNTDGQVISTKFVGVVLVDNTIAPRQ
jgi:hypothetical protein